MRRHDPAKRRIRFSVEGLVRRLQQAFALTAILCLLLPIAAPIPAYAYSVDLRKPPSPQFGLAAPDSSAKSWASDFVSKFTNVSAPLFAPPTTSNENIGSLERTSELAGRVASISTEITEGNEFSIGQLISLAALPKDKKGRIVNGIAAKWNCADSRIVRILNDSEAVAVGEGETKLSVLSGNTLKKIPVRVIRKAGKRLESASAPPDPEQPILSEEQVLNLVTPENNLGSPIGQTEMPSTSYAVAARTRERYGSSNYSFSISAASLPGRGIDASVGITYNSRVWNKFGSTPEARIFSYNVDNNWLAPGFEMGFGDITPFGGGSVSGYMLTSPDGTRHQLLYKQASGQCSIFESTDGTFIQTTICGIYTTSTLNVEFSDGTQVMYGASTASGKRFPIRITDRNGNMVTIAYVQNDTQGKILYVRDTLSRYINFHYETGTTDKKLVAITVPGYDAGAERQTIRFYYEDLTLQAAGRFSAAQVIYPTTPIRVLRFVYFPGTQTGYRYDYSQYFGMIHKIWQLRGMTASTTSLTETGTISGDPNAEPSNWAAWTSYNYPTTAVPSLIDVPKYDRREDDWLGRTTPSAPITIFNIDEAVTPTGCEISSGTCSGTRTVTISAPDGTRSISISKIRPSADWQNGLLEETRQETGSNPINVWSKTRLFWEQGADSQMSGRDNPRLNKIEVTNDANQTRATSFGYDNYNNQISIKEHDFAVPETLGTELRRIEIAYETGGGWIGNRLLRLPKEVKTIVGSTAVSKTVYEYDKNGEAAATALTPRNDISTAVHNIQYQPAARDSIESCGNG